MKSHIPRGTHRVRVDLTAKQAAALVQRHRLKNLRSARAQFFAEHDPRGGPPLPDCARGPGEEGR